jgi:hypothetical protein
MRSFIKVVVAVSVAAFMVSASVAQEQTLEQQEQGIKQELEQVHKLHPDDIYVAQRLHDYEQARKVRAQERAQREADLGPKKLDESELLKCYQMTGDNARQCIEILQYPDPAVRQQRRTQLLIAQQEYNLKRAAQARQEQQELFRLAQEQAQKLAQQRSLEAMPPDVQAMPVCTGKLGTGIMPCRFDPSLHGQLNDRGYDD